MKLGTSISLLRKLLFSDLCLACGLIVYNQKSRLCRDCTENIQSTDLRDRIDKINHHTGIDAAYSGWYFNGPIQSLIHDLKYNGWAFAGEMLGSELAGLFHRLRDGTELIVPIPLHKIRYRERGYNQTYWIARGMKSVWKTPVNKNLLIRVKHTTSQTTLSEKERVENLKGAFRCANSGVDKHILLIDDVLTTGSTLSAAALELKRKGAKSVTAITVATPKLER